MPPDVDAVVLTVATDEVVDDAGFMVQLGPEGATEQANDTVPVKPLTGATEMVEVAD